MDKVESKELALYYDQFIPLLKYEVNNIEKEGGNDTVRKNDISYIPKLKKFIDTNYPLSYFIFVYTKSHEYLYILFPDQKDEFDEIPLWDPSLAQAYLNNKKLISFEIVTELIIPYLFNRQKKDQLQWEQKVRKQIETIEDVINLNEFEIKLKRDFRNPENTGLPFSSDTRGRTTYIFKEDKIIHYSNTLIEHINEQRQLMMQKKKKVDSTNLPKLEWNGNKTELRELIQALYLAEVIRDSESNKAASQRQLIEAFNKVFSMDIKHSDFSGDVYRYYDKHKRRFDNVYYVGELNGTFLDYLEELLKQDKDNRLD